MTRGCLASDLSLRRIHFIGGKLVRLGLIERDIGLEGWIFFNKVGMIRALEKKPTEDFPKSRPDNFTHRELVKVLNNNFASTPLRRTLRENAVHVDYHGAALE